MKLGIVSDVHANIFALEKVMKAIKEEGVDEIVCLGDVCNIGAHPNECFDLLLSSKIPFSMVKGNHEQFLIDIAEGKQPDPRPLKCDYYRMQAENLNPKYMEYIRGLPNEIFRKEEGALFTHFGRDGDGNMLPLGELPILPKNLEKRIPNQGAGTVFFGHTHVAQEDKFDGVQYVNFGALGTPHEGIPMARAGVAEWKNGAWEWKRIAVSYDVAEEIQAIKDMKHALTSEILSIFFHV